MKKRFFYYSLLLILSLIIIFAVTSIYASAEENSGKCGDNLTWSFNTSTGVLTISGSGKMDNYSGSSSVPWNSFRDFIKIVNFRATVTSISDYAFNYCSSLTSVSIGSGVTSIGRYAFNSCTKLTSITIPDNVTSIGSEAFSGCKNLANVTIGNGVVSIGDGSFGDCDSLTQITVSNDNIFYSSINGVLFNKDQTILIRYPINKSGTSYSIPNSVTYIYRSAFSGCIGIKNITIGKKVSNIGNAAFYNCKSLENLIIPNSVANIGNQAFYNCKSLTSISIPDSVISIGWSAFYNCYNLADITISDKVKSIGNDVFTNTKLTKDESNWENDVLYIGCFFIRAKESVSDANIIKPGTLGIAGYAFDNCSSLTEINIPNSVRDIGSGAFCECTGLSSVIIPNSVERIGNNAFAGCTNLISIIFSDNVKVEFAAFYNTGVYNDNNNWDNEVLYLNNYLITAKRSIIGSYLVHNGTIRIADNAFECCSLLTSITIPEGVKSIGNNSFYGCNNLTSVEIPSSVTSIGDMAFSDEANTIFNVKCGSFAYEYCLSNGKQCITSHDYTFVVTAPTRTEHGYTTYTCVGCGYSYIDNYTDPCGVDWYVDNYNFIIRNGADINYMRIAPGVLETSAEIRAAEGLIQVDKKLCDSMKNENGVLIYDFIHTGIYSIWVRYNDDNAYVISGVNIKDILPTIGEVNNLSVTIDNLYLDSANGVKDIWIARGTHDNYAQCKDNTNKIVQITSKKILQANYNYARSYKYEINYKNASENGNYTVCVRFNDNRNPVILNYHVDYPQPEIIINGLQSKVTNLEGVKCIRVAPGEWDDTSEIKRAPGVRVFTSKTILKDKSEYAIQYRDNGKYTLSIEYSGGYAVIKTIFIAHLMPTVDVNESGTVTLGDLDNLYIIRYAPNPKNSTDWSQGYFKQATGNRYAKTADLTNGMFTTEVLPTLQYKDKTGVFTTCDVWTFMVQYTEESYNIFTVNFNDGSVNWLKP